MCLGLGLNTVPINPILNLCAPKNKYKFTPNFGSSWTAIDLVLPFNYSKSYDPFAFIDLDPIVSMFNNELNHH